MKKSTTMALLIAVLAMCFSTTALAERTSSPRTARLVFPSAEIIIPFGNSAFSDFMYDEFEMTTPNAFFGARFSIGSFFGEGQRWLWDFGVNFRASYRSSNNITRDWGQVNTFLTFSYAIIDNSGFRLSPFAGANFGGNMLYFADMREVGGLDNITDVLETSFLQLNLNQWNIGGEIGLRFDFLFEDPTTRFTPHLSAFIAWEQGFFSSHWRIERSEMRDIPKFQHSMLNIGIAMAF